LSKITTSKNSKTLATVCAKLASEKLAKNILVMDLTEIETAPADFFVMCSCESEPQMRSVCDNILRQNKKNGLERPRVEGETTAEWILLDYFDVVVHIMLEEIRSFYMLEKLWIDANFYKFNVETNKLNKIKFTEIAN